MIKILAIDDNRDNLISLKALLTDALPQSVVYMELTGQGGIGSARENDPDVILLDIVMPGMDGYQVCKILKADEQLSETPVIFLTALKGDKQSRILALEAGGEAFLSKPIDSTELKAQILAMLKIKEAATYKRDEKLQLEELVQKRTEELKGANIAALNLLEDLNAEIEIRKQREEALKESERQYAFLAETAFDLVKFTSIQNIYEYTARKLYELMEDQGIVAIVEYDTNSKLWKMQHLKGIDDKYTDLSKIFGFDIRKLEGEISTKYYEKITSGKLEEVEIDFPGLFNNKVSDKIGNTVMKLLSADKMYCIAFHESEQVFGNITLVTKMNAKPLNADLIEAFVLQVTNFIKKQKSEAALKMSKELLSETENIGKVGGWSFNIDTMEQKWTDEVYRIHEVEISPEPGVDAGINYYTRESRPIIGKAVQRAIEHGENYDLELEIITAKGNTRAVHTIGKADLKNRRIYGFFQDITERKQPEKQLKESEEKFKSLMQQSPFVVELYDLNGLQISVNKAYEELWDIPAETTLNKFNVLESKEVEETGLLEYVKRAYAGDSVVVPEYIFDPSGDTEAKGVGRRRWLNTRIYPLKSESGKVKNIVIVHQDITERKRAEEELIKAKEKAEESEKKYRMLFNLNKDSISLLGIGTDGKPTGFIDFNNAACDIFGFSREELMLMKLEELEVPVPDNVLSQRLETLQMKGSVDFETIINDKAGNERYIEVKVILLNYQNQPALMNITRDITERKQAEEALRESEERFRNLVDTINSGVAIYKVINDGISGFDYIIQDFNQFALKHEKLQKEEVIGKSLKDIRPNIDEYGLIDIFRKVWQTGEPTYFPAKVYIDEKYSNYYENRVFKLPSGEIVAVYDDVTEREIAKKTLQKSEERFNLAMNASNDGLFDWNLETNEIYYSPGWKKMLGYEDHELPNDFSVWENTTDSEDVKKSWELQQKLIKKQIDRFVMEFKMKHKNGHWVDILSRAEAIFDDSGKAVRLIGTHTDITERKQAEEKLKLLNRAVEASSVAVEITDAEGNINYVNPFFTELTGYSYEEVLGKNPRFLKSGNHPKEFYKDLWDTILSGKEWKGEFQNKKKNGELYWEKAVISPILNSNGKVSNFVAIKEDITEHKRFEDTRKMLLEISQLATKHSTPTSFLAEVHQKLKKIIRSDNFYVTLYNEADQTFTFPYHVDEYDSIEMNKPYELRNSYTDHVLKTNQSLIVTPENQHAVEKDGSTKEYGDQLSVWLGVPFKTTEGSKPNGVIAIQDYQNRDSYTETDKSIMEIIAHSIGSFIERTKYIEDLVQARKKAEESDRLKSAFLANMSHEIRTPMNGILGFADLLKEPGLTGDEQQQYIEIIEKSGARMLNIINDIVDISKIEAGLMKCDMKESNINEQIEYVYTFFRPQVEAKGMQLILSNALPAGQEKTITDREKLYAILTNLVKNAIKYSKEGAIEYGCNKKGSFLEFFIRDTGIGIPKDRQHAIFDRFVQADIEDKEAREGAGLGLAISKAYVEMLGGEIWVESEEGKGSTFYFTLPYNSEPKKETTDLQPASSDKTDTIRELKILVAEDDEVSEMLIDSYIKMFGKEILKARTGVEAVEACRDNPDIDLILMDIRMPVMGGYEATRQIREFNQEVIIIAQTAYGLTGDRGKSLEAGCNDYIAKPINKTELQAMIQKHFGK